MKVLTRAGEQRVVTTGFSFTSLFFGIFVPISRGDGKGLLIQLFLGFITCGFSWLIIPFTYNRAYEDRLRNRGWKTLN
mgnify:CR=1 FL=1